jgi:Dyp-type peroxidase family
MTNALVTIVAPLAPDRVARARDLIDGELGNPPRRALEAALDGLTGEADPLYGRVDGVAGVHFMSLHAFAGSNAAHVHLILEYSADPGDPNDPDRLGWIVARIGPALAQVFALASDWRSGDLLAFLKDHRIAIGHGWFDTPGLAFAGTPGIAVGTVRAEAALANHLTTLVGAQPGGLRPLERVRAVRDALAGTDWQWALDTPPPPLPPYTPTTLGQRIAPLVWSFLKTFLAPVLLLVALLAIGAIVVAVRSWSWLGVAVAALGFVIALAIVAGVVLVAALILYSKFRKAEDSDWLDERAPERPTLAKIRARENQPGYAHNHMVSITTLKPGFIRGFTIRLAFWLIAELARLSFRPGYLGNIGTIHFARWVTVPGTRDLIFFSNFGGSWESYLEDFITKAHDGLTAVWSNTIGYPRTRNLFQQGATDGERFKRYARRSMLHTPFWYSAYPALTTSNIRTNSAIRRGLATVLTDEEAINWLAAFASVVRPDEKIESSQVQSLVFGGLGFMPFGECLILDLGADRDAARVWLRETLPHIAFDDGRRLDRDAVLTLAVMPGALTTFGLDAQALETFPAAFLDGMAAPGRDRILGDLGDNGPDQWYWARPGERIDAALLVYGTSLAAVATLVARVEATCRAGQTIRHRIPLNCIPEDKAQRREPFGFIDGTSQPVIRGTYRGLRNPDAIHLVQPGEFILGYPDNRGNMPPRPTLAAIHDPENRLPISADCAGFTRTVVDAPRDLARNGSFLVIRQLEQDVDRFQEYCANEAARLTNRLGAPFVMTADFICAKMVGRWADGSSLVRFPYESETTIKARKPPALQQKPTSRPTSVPQVGTPIQPGTAPQSAAGEAEPTAPPACSFVVPGHEHAVRSSEDNDFLFGTEDPEGLRCPFGAHIRRANPRDSLEPGSAEQVDITNRHRILRVGRSYPPQGKDGRPGLLFMCLNGDIERQFEFVQQTWLGSPAFHGLSNEVDPLMGDGSVPCNGFTMPTRDGPVRFTPMQRFVTTRGGGYFFLPGKRLLEYLAG